MIGYLKKQSIIFYLSLIIIILNIAGMVFSIQSSTGAYQITKLNYIVTAIVVATVLNAIGIFLWKDSIGKDIAQWIQIILITIAICYILNARAELIGFIYFSDLEKGNPIAIAAMHNAIFSWVFLGISLLFGVVKGFCKGKTE